MEKLSLNQHAGRGRRANRLERHIIRATTETEDMEARFNGTHASVRFLGTLMFGVDLDKPDITHTIEITLAEPKSPRELYARLLKAIE